MKNGIINTVIIAGITLVVFCGIKVSFSLMNLASTMWNGIGFLLLVGILTFAFYEVKEIIKALNKD
jgi:energy-coupling factor transporter transmembrane protein EcfT